VGVSRGICFSDPFDACVPLYQATTLWMTNNSGSPQNVNHCP